MPDDRSVLVFAGKDQSAAEFELLDENRKSYLPVGQIKANLSDFMESLAEILPTVGTVSGGYGLESFTVAVGINGKGQVGFLGTGGELGGTATLTLTFKRPTSQHETGTKPHSTPS